MPNPQAAKITLKKPNNDEKPHLLPDLSADGAFRAYLKTVNMPKQRAFSVCCAPFSLQYAKYSSEKMASSGKTLVVGHISGFQIDHNKYRRKSEICGQKRLNFGPFGHARMAPFRVVTM